MPFSVRDSLRGKHFFITGGTGFLGLALIEKLVREIDSCSLSLLIRAEDDEKANRRFQAILDQEALFDDQDKSRYSRIRCYAGDISRENLGLSEAALAEWKPDLDIVIHAAASVNFDDPINVAIENNIYGPLHVLEFCRKTEAALLHVSTAYVCGNLTGPIHANVTEDMLNRLVGGSASAELAHMEQMLARFQKENATLSSKRRIKALMEMGKEYALSKGWSDIYTLVCL